MIQCLELSKQKSKLWMILIPPLVLMASQSRLSLIGNLSSFHGLILALILSLREQEFFVDGHGARKCIQAGAKKVIITAPAKGADIPTYVVGVNKGIVKGTMASTHSYARDQVLALTEILLGCRA
ncbi:hypothetical protein SLEP1_g51621 [Rubroshorea leprosula]|uniref:Uncharacterized protein n=1 Tax=Rubroshorea leprosula TaxID=152421 RepID=A0AAV5M728_9ROSI|nr:hypothetical protein SLEP1_g51621 [Rubroshorea leprosula]